MRILQIDRMPTRSEFETIDMTWLVSAIGRSGGLIKWAEKLNLEVKNKTIKWNEKLIEEKIFEVIKALGINRMPSRSEIEKVCQDKRLTNIISKKGGYKYWADKLNLEFKESETKSGWDYEEVIIDKLINKGYKVERMTTLHPYDLLINGKVKVDVKMGCAYDLRGSRVHTFGLSKKYSTCDIYIVVALNGNGDKIERIFIIPGYKLKIVTLSVGEFSKYNKYINKWDIIDQFIKAYENIVV